MIHIEGELQIDTRRGVIYFHSKETGASVLRICRLEIPKDFNPAQLDSIDITHMHGASYT